MAKRSTNDRLTRTTRGRPPAQSIAHHRTREGNPLNRPALRSHPGRFSTRRIALVILIVAAGTFLLARQDWFSPRLDVTTGINGSGTAATQTRTLPSFTAIDLAGVSTITVHVGARQAVVVHADDNLINHIETDVRNGSLVVSERGRLASNLPLSVEVTVPSLDSTRLMGSGTITVDGVLARTFTAELLGSGMLTIVGTADQLDASLAGSGIMQLGGLTARSVTATVPGSGRLEVHATHRLEASIAGSGEIAYGGHPRALKRDVSGSGVVLPR